MHTQVVQLVTFIVAFSLAATRILTASKAFWGLFPSWLAGVLPGLIVAVPALGQAVVGAQSWTDLTVAFLTAGALLLPGAHSHTVGKSATPPAAKSISVPPKPAAEGHDPIFPSATIRGLAALVLCALTLVVGSVGACKGSVLPVIENCAGAPQVDIDIITKALFSPDWETAIASAVATWGTSFVVCVVEGLETTWTAQQADGGVGSADTAVALSHARAFLAKVQAAK